MNRSIRSLAAALVLLHLGAFSVQAQRVALPPAPDTLVAANYDALTFVSPVAPVDARRGVARIQFEYDLIGFPPEAEAAIRFAGDIWASHLESSVPIRVRATFDELESDQLGAAGPACVEARDELPIPDTWYGVALAEALLGQELNPPGAEICGGVDIVATFNRTLDVDENGTTDWYFGTDGNTPPGRFDFASVVLHELGHGLGFIGSFVVATSDESCPAPFQPVALGSGCWGLGGSGSTPLLPFIFDRFTEDGQDVSLLNTSVYPNPSPALGDALRSEAIRFDGPTSVAANGTIPIDLYAPSNFEPGSSYSHLDEEVSPPGDPNSLMTPQLARAEAIFSPGPFTCAVMDDIGWTLGPDCEALLRGGLVGFSGRAEGRDIVLTFRLGIGSTFTTAILEREVGEGDFEATGASIGPLDPESAGAYTVRLNDFAPGRYAFRLRLVRTDASEALSRLVVVTVPPDQRLAVFPNPFRNEARVVLDLSDRDDADPIRVTVYDVLGRRVVRLFSGTPAASLEVLDLTLDGTGLTPGIYFVRVDGSGVGATRTVTRVR